MRDLTDVLLAALCDIPDGDRQANVYDEYRTGESDLGFRRALGRRLASWAGRPVRVLYIGSGPGTYLRSLTLDTPTARFECVSVDPTVGTPCTVKHIMSGWEDVDLANTWPNPTDADHRFDVMIIDAEPHGREISIFEKFRPRLAPESLLVAKCIGSMNTGGAYMAEWLARHLVDNRCLRDYYFPAHVDHRDVYFVVSQGRTDVMPRVHNAARLAMPTMRWSGINNRDVFQMCYEGQMRSIEEVTRRVRLHGPFDDEAGRGGASVHARGARRKTYLDGGNGHDRTHVRHLLLVEAPASHSGGPGTPGPG